MIFPFNKVKLNLVTYYFFTIKAKKCVYINYSISTKIKQKEREITIPKIDFQEETFPNWDLLMFEWFFTRFLRIMSTTSRLYTNWLFRGFMNNSIISLTTEVPRWMHICNLLYLCILCLRVLHLQLENKWTELSLFFLSLTMYSH